MTLYVGVDVAKRTLVAALCQGEGTLDLGEFDNAPPGFVALAQAVAAQGGSGEAVRMTLEATGSYHLALVVTAQAWGWQVSLPNPQRVRAWVRGVGRRAKSDALDARMLARYALHCQPPAEQPLPTAVQELESLLRRKQDIEQMLGQERNRQESLRHRPAVPASVTHSLAQVQQALEAAHAEVEAAIEHLLRQQPDLARQRRQLCTVPGIGARNVLPLLVLLYRWEAHTAGAGSSKGLTAYVGLDPVTCQSGASLHPSAAISKMGNAELRRRLYLSALGATNARATPLTVFYHRLLAHDKPKMVALIACARKILVWALAVFRSGANFRPELAMPKLAA